MTPGQDKETIIRERAYYIWETSGRPDGQAELHWFKAVDEIITPAMTTSEPAARKKAPAKKAAAPAMAKKATTETKKAPVKKAITKKAAPKK